MAEGYGCKCYAMAEHECVCDVDWTPHEVIRLRAVLDKIINIPDDEYASVSELQDIAREARNNG